MDQKEIDAISKCQKGDLKEFGILYDKYIRKIYDFVFYKTHHKETAEDLTSKAFMKALKSITSFYFEKGTFQAWLYQIARNTVIDHYRTAKHDQNIEDAWDLCGHEDLVRDIDVKHKLEKIEKYIKALKPGQRDVVLMRVWQGMSYREIAAVLGQSEAGCKMAYSRAIKKLKDDMPLSLFLSLVFLNF